MTCERVAMPGGGVAIVCGPRRRKRKCSGCGAPADLECDWKMPNKKSGTCDAAICSRCTTSPAPDKDICPKHRPAFEAWEANRKLTRAQGQESGGGDTATPFPAV